MARKGRAQLRALSQRLSSAHPDLDADAAIGAGHVRVDGRVITNPRSLVRDDASITVQSADATLRGEAKLEAALEAFSIAVEGRVALDLGASSGGFTRVLLRGGATRVYAVDVGFGQLLGSLRQSSAVVNLERTNLADLSVALVPDEIDLVTADLSYLSLASALPQLNGGVRIAPQADLVALIKPMFELRLARPPQDPGRLAEACRHASDGAAAAGWHVERVIRSPARGSAGAIEFFLHARRRTLAREPAGSISSAGNCAWHQIGEEGRSRGPFSITERVGS